MTEEKITITIRVAQQPIELTIKPEWEYIYRDVEKTINKSFQEFAKKWQYRDPHDLLAKILVHYVTLWRENEERLSEMEEELIPKMQEMKTLADELNIE
jgi:hypothetical protein